MCVTLGEAHLSQTTLYAGVSRAFTREHGVLHVCGYQNRVKNLMSQTHDYHALGWGREQREGKKDYGNAMILPFPAVPGTMSQKNFLTGMDTCPHVLQDMVAAISPPTPRGLNLYRGGEKSLSVEIFELDIYTIVLAQNARLIPDAVKSVREEKRPPLKPSIFLAYDEWYPNWPVAVCCFNNEEAALANPIMAYYEPLRPEFLFMPTLDSHTGDIPDLNAQVRVDHTLVVGTDQDPQEKGKRVTYQDSIPAHIKPHLPDRVMGASARRMRNGDFVFRMDQVQEGTFNPMRLLPPGASRA